MTEQDFTDIINLEETEEGLGLMARILDGLGAKISGALQSRKTSRDRWAIDMALKNIKPDVIDCKAVKMRDVFFDLDDTLVSGYVGDVDKYEAHNIIRNLKLTKEKCGFPRIHVVSTNSQIGVQSTLKRNFMQNLFDSEAATGSDKSKRIFKVLKKHKTKPEEAVMIGHDLQYDFGPIKQNKRTMNVNIRLIEDKISQFDRKLKPNEVERLKKNGVCTIKHFTWDNVRKIVVGDGCREDNDKILRDLKTRAKRNLAAQDAAWHALGLQTGHAPFGSDYAPFCGETNKPQKGDPFQKNLEEAFDDRSINLEEAFEDEAYDDELRNWDSLSGEKQQELLQKADEKERAQARKGERQPKKTWEEFAKEEEDKYGIKFKLK